jgi:enamine deaminase RidA (YjgF/YER057c/UK114 family)
MGRTVLGPVGTPYSVGLKVSGSETVYLAGHLAVDESGALVAPGDMEGQARYIFESMAKILAEAGGSLSDVVKITAYITTLEGYKSYGTVRRDVFGENLPTSATLQVAGLVIPGCVIEIEAVAVLGM